MADDVLTRPEIIRLGPETRNRIRNVAAQRIRCGSCGGTDFEIGDALYLGFLFLDEDDDAYLVALTCNGQQCSQPHTGITVRGNRSQYPEFADR